MQAHITMLYGIGQASAAAVAMKNVNTIAKSMGFNELGFYVYPVSTDSDRDLNMRFDGILASIWHDDIVVLQHPTWNDLRYEEVFIRKVRSYSNTKLIIFVHDVISLMLNLNEGILRDSINIYNKADVLILPSRELHEFLISKGLTAKKVIYQEVWDYPITLHDMPVEFVRKLHFLGNAQRYPFIKQWNGNTSIELYGSTPFTDDPRFIFNPIIKSDLLVYKIDRKGFGLIWAGDEQYEYAKYNNPFKLGTFLAAGVPVIVQKGTHAEQFVKKHNVGFIAESLEEVDNIVQTISEEEFWAVFKNVSSIQYLIANGYYTRKLLNDAVTALFD